MRGGLPGWRPLDRSQPGLGWGAGQDGQARSRGSPTRQRAARPGLGEGTAHLASHRLPLPVPRPGPSDPSAHRAQRTPGSPPSLRLSAPHTQHLLPGLSPRAPDCPARSLRVSHAGKAQFPPRAPSQLPTTLDSQPHTQQSAGPVHPLLHPRLTRPLQPAQSSLMRAFSQPRAIASAGPTLTPTHLHSLQGGRVLQMHPDPVTSLPPSLAAPSREQVLKVPPRRARSCQLPPLWSISSPLSLCPRPTSLPTQSHHGMLPPAPRAPQGAFPAASLPEALPRAPWPLLTPQHPPQATLTQLSISLLSVAALG